MSCSKLLSSFTDAEKEEIHSDLEVEVEDKGRMSGMFGKNPVRYVYAYEMDDDRVYLPFSYAYTTRKFERPKRKKYKFLTKFEGSLREAQVEVKDEAIKVLNKTGSILLSLHVGFGKTCLAIYLACLIKLPTLIIANKIVLMNQWKESILKFCPGASVQIIKPSSAIKPGKDFYIVNAINVPKMGTESFKHIGNLVIDECHLIMAETLSKCMTCVMPRYLLGLSATPYRPDGLDSFLSLYFGNYKIIRELYREHSVQKILTGFSPKVEFGKNGKINWGSVLDSQARYEPRNELIIDLVKENKDRSFLILVKRIHQGEYLAARLEEEEESVTSLLGKSQEFDREARILVGTTSKVGVGFDHPKLDALILATDLEEYFIQYLGRVFRRKDTLPIVFDIVDENKVLKRHWTTRAKVYKKHGGKIEIIKRPI